MLELRPITVNKKMQVIDGQHRLEAAKALGIPMFYVVDKESELEDIVRLNNSQKSWILEDYVNYHASDGVKFFVDIVNLAKKLDITINHLVRYLGISGGSSWKKMKDGSYEFDLEKTGKELQEKLAFIDGILKFIEEKTIGNKKYLKSMAITKGLLTLMNSSMFNADIFFKKVELCITRIHICRTVEKSITKCLKAFITLEIMTPSNNKQAIHIADLAQLVEHPTCNGAVESSILSVSKFIGYILFPSHETIRKT